jgi:hypothetical protein
MICLFHHHSYNEYFLVPLIWKLVRVFPKVVNVGEPRWLKNGVFWDVTPCGSVRTNVSEEPSASFIRVTRIVELGTTLAAKNVFAACVGC